DSDAYDGADPDDVDFGSGSESADVDGETFVEDGTNSTTRGSGYDDGEDDGRVDPDDPDFLSGSNSTDVDMDGSGNDLMTGDPDDPDFMSGDDTTSTDPADSDASNFDNLSTSFLNSTSSGNVTALANVTDCGILSRAFPALYFNPANCCAKNASVIYCDAANKTIYANLAHLGISGPLPSILSSLTNLQFLYLSNNKISGPIPGWFAQMTSLIELEINNNYLSGQLLATFPPQLQNLQLSNNDLTGHPADLGMMTSLNTLFLDGNYITGEFPGWLEKLRFLTYLDLSSNRFYGQIPNFLAGMPLLSIVNLADNRLFGSISNAFTSSTISILDIRENDFSGNILPAAMTIPYLIYDEFKVSYDNKTLCSFCSHSPAVTGEALVPFCGACSAAMFSRDPFCTVYAWDATCVAEAQAICTAADLASTPLCMEKAPNDFSLPIFPTPTAAASRSAGITDAPLVDKLTRFAQPAIAMASPNPNDGPPSVTAAFTPPARPLSMDAEALHLPEEDVSQMINADQTATPADTANATVAMTEIKPTGAVHTASINGDAQTIVSSKASLSIAPSDQPLRGQMRSKGGLKNFRRRFANSAMEEDEEEEQEDMHKVAQEEAALEPIVPLSHKEVDEQYPGDPHPPMSKEELRAFYIYSWSVEPVVIVCMTALIPLILQTLAAANGFEVDDHTKPCNYTATAYSCVVLMGNSWIDVSSFALYTLAISVGMQAFLFISLGAVADHGAWRKRFMVGFMVASVSCCLLFLTIRGASSYWFAAILTILVNVFFGSSYVFYDGYIPLLVRAHWDYRSRKYPANLTATQLLRRKNHAFDQVSNTLSTFSTIIGYIGAIACFATVGAVIFATQLISPSTGFGDGGFGYDNPQNEVAVSTYAKQLGVAFTGVWALIGMYYPIRYMRVRPGPPLPSGENYLFYSWKKVGKTVMRARKLPNTFLLLVAWFLLSDGLTTVGSVTILFAQNQLGFTGTQLIILAIGAPITAAGGNYLWLLFQRRFKWSTKSMIVLLLALVTGLPVYGILGIFAPFGLKHQWELIPCGVYYGCLLGAIQSFCRVQFAELLPEGQESEFFALYSITDKGSSWFGPLIVGAIADVSHEIRYGFVFLFFLLLIPVILVWFVDAEKGKKDVARLLEEDEREAEAALKADGSVETVV
ncbi:Autophagy protein 22, partial [Irineochytrium annulatum]